MKSFTLKSLRRIQLFWGFFIGVGAYFGAFMMITDPSGETFGMAPMLPYFQTLPFAEKLFQNFLVSGILLLLINGVTNTISVIMLLKHYKYGALSGLCCGIILMLWIIVQLIIFRGFNPVSVSFFIFGLLQAFNGWMLVRKGKQEDITI